MIDADQYLKSTSFWAFCTVLSASVYLILAFQFLSLHLLFCLDLMRYRQNLYYVIASFTIGYSVNWNSSFSSGTKCNLDSILVSIFSCFRSIDSKAKCSQFHSFKFQLHQRYSPTAPPIMQSGMSLETLTHLFQTKWLRRLTKYCLDLLQILVLAGQKGIFELLLQYYWFQIFIELKIYLL